MGALHTLKQILIHQGRRGVEQIYAQIAVCIADGFGSLKRATTNEHREAPEQHLLRFIQELMTPANRVPKCLLPLRQVEGAAGQQL